MSVKIQSIFFSIAIIFSACTFLHADKESPLDQDNLAIVQDGFRDNVITTAENKENELGIKSNDEKLSLEQSSSVQEKNNFKLFDVVKKQLEDFSDLNYKHPKIVTNFSDHFISNVLDCGNQGISQLSQTSKKALINALTLSVDDTLECDKVGGICAITVAAIASFCMRKSSFKEGSIDVNTTEKRKSFIKTRIQTLRKNFYKIALPLFFGGTIYKLVSTNAEVKASLCTQAAFLRDKIQVDDVKQQ
jgi:hypothetical protein